MNPCGESIHHQQTELKILLNSYRCDSVETIEYGDDHNLPTVGGSAARFLFFSQEKHKSFLVQHIDLFIL